MNYSWHMSCCLAFWDYDKYRGLQSVHTNGLTSMTYCSVAASGARVVSWIVQTKVKVFCVFMHVCVCVREPHRVCDYVGVFPLLDYIQPHATNQISVPLIID